MGMAGFETSNDAAEFSTSNYTPVAEIKKIRSEKMAKE